jgi:hypothetical protein
MVEDVSVDRPATSRVLVVQWPTRAAVVERLNNSVLAWGSSASASHMMW